MGDLMEVMEDLPEFVVVRDRNYNTALLNLKNNEHRYGKEFMRKCFKSMFDSGVIITKTQHEEQERRRKEEKEAREKRWAEYQRRRRLQRPVSQRRLRKMLKYFCRKEEKVWGMFKRRRKVRVRYVHNDSMGGHYVDEKVGRPADFHVETHKFPGEEKYVFWIKFSDGEKFEVDVCWFDNFVGLGKIEIPMGGPSHFFSISFA